MTGPDGSSPPPVIAGLQRQVAELVRRVRDLETSAGARPAATAIAPAAYPWSDGASNITRVWAGTSAAGWQTMYVWSALMEWTELDLLLAGVSSGDRSWQARVTCGGQVLWTSDVRPAPLNEIEAVIPLADLLVGDVAGSTRPFTIDMQISGGSSGAVYLLPKRLLHRGPRFT